MYMELNQIPYILYVYIIVNLARRQPVCPPYIGFKVKYRVRKMYNILTKVPEVKNMGLEL